MQIDTGIARRRRVIGLTPLIDVVFILLLFFMLATNFQQWRSLTLNAPGNSPTAEASDDSALLLQISAGDPPVLRLSGEIVALHALGQRLQPFLRRNPEQLIVVQPDPEVTLQPLVSLFDQLAAGGAQRITLGEAR